ncbi:MAG: hypothetical protein KGI33_05020 [Thaumarchaeota archaeon]|nr:hypothetical protein [Nitrososphaerota archaeon]
MGRTIPSFRIALHLEEKRWKPFRDALDRKDRVTLDRMFLASRLHVSACMMAARPVRIHCMMMAMLLHQYKQLLSLGI